MGLKNVLLIIASSYTLRMLTDFVSESNSSGGKPKFCVIVDINHYFIFIITLLFMMMIIFFVFLKPRIVLFIMKNKLIKNLNLIIKILQGVALSLVTFFSSIFCKGSIFCN